METLRETDPGKLYSVADVQALIPSTWKGKDRVCRKIIYRWLLTGRLQGQRVGRTWLVTGAAILEFLQLQDQENAPWKALSSREQKERDQAMIAQLLAKFRKGRPRNRRQASATP